jgi:hypothetical protein
MLSNAKHPLAHDSRPKSPSKRCHLILRCAQDGFGFAELSVNLWRKYETVAKNDAMQSIERPLLFSPQFFGDNAKKNALLRRRY